MVIELTGWCERQKTKQAGTFRASILVYSFEHLLSIGLATLLDHIFVLCQRYRFPMWTMAGIDIPVLRGCDYDLCNKLEVRLSGGS